MTTVILETVCPFCNAHRDIEISAIGYFNLRYSNMNVLDALKGEGLSLDDIESIISGICPKCWAETLPDTEED